MFRCAVWRLPSMKCPPDTKPFLKHHGSRHLWTQKRIGQLGEHPSSDPMVVGSIMDPTGQQAHAYDIPAYCPTPSQIKHTWLVTFGQGCATTPLSLPKKTTISAPAFRMRSRCDATTLFSLGLRQERMPSEEVYFSATLKTQVTVSHDRC